MVSNSRQIVKWNFIYNFILYISYMCSYILRVCLFFFQVISIMFFVELYRELDRLKEIDEI